MAESYEQTSDYAVPWWHLNAFRSLLLARLGEEHAATDAQDHAPAELSPSLPRFATRLQLHQGLMLARSGDRAPRRHRCTISALKSAVNCRLGRGFLFGTFSIMDIPPRA
ncbi:hypothetical protein [Streptomyces sp. NPDC089915]|uniref:hypothetical protein n=1 Tax=Streptomyces sp. NPDC089915 TaxID=3155186 RepID=UPI003439C450